MATITIACHKDPINQPEPPIVATGLKVKDIIEKNLPSPYYHFEYNDTGNITIAGFQSGLRTYDVEYMVRILNQCKIQLTRLTKSGWTMNTGMETSLL